MNLSGFCSLMMRSHSAMRWRRSIDGLSNVIAVSIPKRQIQSDYLPGSQVSRQMGTGFRGRPLFIAADMRADFVDVPFLVSSLTVLVRFAIFQ